LTLQLRHNYVHIITSTDEHRGSFASSVVSTAQDPSNYIIATVSRGQLDIDIKGWGMATKFTRQAQKGP
jgi:hypothetical protein